MNLRGKVAVVTGGSRGLGRDLASLFHSAGANVVVCARSPEPVPSHAPDLPSSRWYSSWHSADLAVRTDVEAFASSVLEAHGRVDILVNSAGYGGILAPLWETAESEFDSHVAVNLLAPFVLIKQLLHAMLPLDQAWIVNVASQAGKRAVPNLAAYSATKFAVVGMTQALAKELQNSNITCLTVCPGGMDTEMRASLFGREDSARQQSTMSVASLIKDLITGVIPVVSGAEVLVKEGRIQRIELSPNY